MRDSSRGVFGGKDEQISAGNRHRVGRLQDFRS